MWFQVCLVVADDAGLADTSPGLRKDHVVAGDMIKLVVVIGGHRDLHLTYRHHINVIHFQVRFDFQLFAFCDEATSAVPTANFDALLCTIAAVPVRDVHVFVDRKACVEEAGFAGERRSWCQFRVLRQRKIAGRWSGCMRRVLAISAARWARTATGCD